MNPRATYALVLVLISAPAAATLEVTVRRADGSPAANAVVGHDGHCVTAWNKALRLVGKGLSWKRPIDFSRGNSTGRVDFQTYCAPRNTLLPPEDGQRCCSRWTGALTPTDAAASVATGESLVACD